MTRDTMTKDLAKVWAERMTKAERDQSFPDSEPRDAATLMLIDRSGLKPKVLLGRRHQGHKFMPGKFVFPGGRIEPLDRVMPAASELHPETQKKLLERVQAPGDAFARGMALAAVREMAEETGLLLGVKRDEPPAAPGEIWADFAKARVHPDLAHIHFIARAVTPPRRPTPLRHAVSSPPTSPRSRTKSKAWWDRTPNWSNSPGCRSRKPPTSTCRPSPGWCWKSWRPGSRPAWATTCRCRIIS